jgi:hypothetical protein
MSIMLFGPGVTEVTKAKAIRAGKVCIIMVQPCRNPFRIMLLFASFDGSLCNK